MKLLKNIVLVFVVFQLLTSCVPYRETLYLEKNKDKVSEIEINADAFKPYRVQVNDILVIKIKALDQNLVNIFNKTESENQAAISEQMIYFDGYQVDDYGNVRIPIIGLMKVEGQTVDEISKLIETKLVQEYLYKETNPFVTVKIAGIKYTVNGEVGSTGTKIIYQEKATILEALANAGEIRDTGDKRNVLVMRKIPGGYQSETLNLNDAKSINSAFFYIKPNDLIYVKPLKQKSLGIGSNGLQTVTTVLSLFGVVATTYLLIKSL